MTTLTEPPLIVPAVDVAELPALDQPDERVCEIRDLDGLPCGQAAAWVATGHCDNCGPERALMCQPCRDDVREIPLECVTCQIQVMVTNLERL